MEATLIKDSNPDFPLKANAKSRSHSHSHSKSFISHGGFQLSSPYEISDIEMINVKSVTYTSLKDLLPSSPPQPSIMSPTMTSSWPEIPIKNPLVKHAAMAYLQPMCSPPEIGNKGLFEKLKEKCFCGGEFGCFGWLYDVVLSSIKDVFGDYFCNRGRFEGEEEDEEDEDDEKVD